MTIEPPTAAQTPAHFGYPTELPKNHEHGLWENDPRKVRNKLATLLPEIADFYNLFQGKFRITLDYDPEFPRALSKFSVCSK